jgi:hypothetical protein
MACPLLTVTLQMQHCEQRTRPRQGTSKTYLNFQQLQLSLLRACAARVLSGICAAVSTVMEG